MTALPFLGWILAASLGGTLPARADSKTILDIDACLNRAHQVQLQTCPARCGSQTGQDRADCLNECALDWPGDDVQAKCVAQPNEGQPVSEGEIRRLCEMSRSDPYELRSVILRNSFHVEEGLIETAIKKECDRREADRGAQEEKRQAKEAILGQESKLQNDLDAALAASDEMDARAEVAADKSQANLARGRAKLERAQAAFVALCRQNDAAQRSECPSDQSPEGMAEAQAKALTSAQGVIHRRAATLRDDITARRTDLLLVNRCFQGLKLDIRGGKEDGDPADTALAEGATISGWYASLDKVVLENAQGLGERGQDLDRLIEKGRLTIDKGAVEKEKAEYAASRDEAVRSPDNPIRKGDNGYDNCLSLMGRQAQ